MKPFAILNVFERVTPNVIYRVRTNRPLVGLSFDDGPHPIFTPEVLDILQQHNAHATFFLIGDQALRHPEVVASIKAGRHEVGNHYFMDASVLATLMPSFATTWSRLRRQSISKRGRSSSAHPVP